MSDIKYCALPRFAHWAGLSDQSQKNVHSCATRLNGCVDAKHHFWGRINYQYYISYACMRPAWNGTSNPKAGRHESWVWLEFKRFTHCNTESTIMCLCTWGSQVAGPDSGPRMRQTKTCAWRSAQRLGKADFRHFPFNYHGICAANFISRDIGPSVRYPRTSRTFAGTLLASLLLSNVVP